FGLTATPGRWGLPRFVVPQEPRCPSPGSKRVPKGTEVLCPVLCLLWGSSLRVLLRSAWRPVTAAVLFLQEGCRPGRTTVRRPRQPGTEYQVGLASRAWAGVSVSAPGAAQESRS